MTLTDPRDFAQLLARLAHDLAADDAAVVSVAARRGRAGAWSHVYGSILIGPADMAASSWLDWRAACGDAPAAQVSRLLARQGVTTSSFADFAAADGDWLIARAPLAGQGSALDQARRWVHALAGPGAPLPQADGGRYLLTANLQAADALVLSGPWRLSGLLPLVSAARRPVLGYRFPLSEPGLAAPTPRNGGRPGPRRYRSPFTTCSG